jgi:hypothetical protein
LIYYLEEVVGGLKPSGRLHIVNLQAASQRNTVRRAQSGGRLKHSVKCTRIWLAVSLVPQRQPHCICRAGGRPRLAFERRNLSLVGPIPAAKCGEVRRTGSEIAGLFWHIVKWHLVLGETGAATPTARHLRTSRAPNEIEWP